MRRPRTRLVAIPASILVAATATIGGPEPVAAGPPIVPMVGEVFLTPAERHAALNQMTAHEKEVLGYLFADDAPGLLVAYARAELAVTETPDGKKSVEPVGFQATNPIGNLSLPSFATAATSATGTKSGTQLFLSLVISKTRSTSPYEWEIYTFAQWGSNGSYSPTGMDCCNNYDDFLGVAWQGGLALWTDQKNGKYQAWCTGEPALNIATNKVTPNAGIAWDFREWWDPDNCPMYYGHSWTRIRETTWKNKLSNATSEYFHTWGGQSYSIGISATGPSLTISPTNESWSFPLYVAFTH